MYMKVHLFEVRKESVLKQKNHYVASKPNLINLRPLIIQEHLKSLPATNLD